MYGVVLLFIKGKVTVARRWCLTQSESLVDEFAFVEVFRSIDNNRFAQLPFDLESTQC